MSHFLFVMLRNYNGGSGVANFWWNEEEEKQKCKILLNLWQLTFQQVCKRVNVTKQKSEFYNISGAYCILRNAPETKRIKLLA